MKDRIKDVNTYFTYMQEAKAIKEAEAEKERKAFKEKLAKSSAICNDKELVQGLNKWTPYCDMKMDEIDKEAYCEEGQEYVTKFYFSFNKEDKEMDKVEDAVLIGGVRSDKVSDQNIMNLINEYNSAIRELDSFDIDSKYIRAKTEEYEDQINRLVEILDERVTD